MPLKRLKPTVRRKRSSPQDDQILLQHDNARPHAALRTQETINKMSWTIFPDPPYSPDFAPVDCHLLGKLEESLRGNHYASVEDVKRGVQTWIKQMPAAFYERGIMDLVPRWQKCIAGDGDYVEK